jgi:pyruvate dehydrogenase (quinone)
MPPRITARQAGGFALWASRSVLSGSGDQVVELARSNLRQLERE